MLRYVISLLGVVVLITFALTIDFGEVLHALTGVRPLFLLLGLSFSLGNIYLKAVRWRLMIKEVAHSDVGFAYAFGAVFAGVAGASLLPGRAFEVTKPIMLKNSHDVAVGKTLPAVLFERLLDLASLCAVFLVSAWFVSARIQSAGTVPVIMAAIGLLCLVVVIWRPEWGLLLVRKATNRLNRSRLSSAIDSLERFVVVWQRRDVKFAWLSLSVAAMIAEVARAYALFAAFGITASPGLIAFAFTGSILAGLLSLIPGGIGVTETSQFGFLTILLPGIAGGALQGAVLLDRFISYYLLVGIGALVLLFIGRNGRVSVHGTRSGTEATVP